MLWDAPNLPSPRLSEVGRLVYLFLLETMVLRVAETLHLLNAQ